MNFFSSLTKTQKIAGLCMIATKFFGLLSVVSMLVVTVFPAIPIAMGSLWLGFLIATFVACAKCINQPA